MTRDSRCPNVSKDSASLLTNRTGPPALSPTFVSLESVELRQRSAARDNPDANDASCRTIPPRRIAHRANPTATTRHTTARKLGIPILSPAQGSTRLDEAVREAELKAYERQRDIDRYATLRHQRADEADAYWRPSWRREELDHDPEPEPWWE
jgi:hypothetical protein